MSCLKSISTHALGEAMLSKPDNAFAITGDPQFSTWSCFEDKVYSGVWMATPGEHKVERDAHTLEQFYILEGEIELHEDGEIEPQRFVAGDLVVIKPNFRGIWRTLSTVKKVYFTVGV